MNTRRRISQHINKFSQMDVRELGLFLRAWITLSGWWIRVRIGSIPEAATDALPAQQPTTRSAQAQDAESSFVRSSQLAVQRAENYHFIRGNCLLRSLTLRSLLQVHNIPSRLCLGVRPQSPRAIEAHAWLEVGTMTLGRKIPSERDHDPFEHRI